MEIDVCDALDKFSDVFDVEYYHKNFHEYVYMVWRHAKTSVFCRELFPIFKSRGLSFDVKCKCALLGLKGLIRKLSH